MDHTGGYYMAMAIMLALIHREKTGEGSFVSTSLAANGVWANGMALQGVVAGNNIGTYRQKKGWPNPFTDAYQCAEGDYVVLAVINTAREYPQLAAALDRSDWLADERFANVGAVMKNRAEFRLALGEAIGQLPFEEVGRRLDQAGVTYSRVQPMADILEDEQMRANGIVVPTEDEGEGYGLTIGSPINVAEAPKRKPSRAPDVGANSVEVLREMDVADDEIQALLGSGVVMSAEDRS